MSKIQLFRIDDRLIHGQVVLGWVSVLNSDCIIVCDNSVFENDWQKELYLSCAPDYLKTMVLDVKGTAEYLKNNKEDFSKTIVLVNSPQVVEELLNSGVELQNINVGGVHFREGRKSILPYLYLNDGELDSFKRCIEKGVNFECLDVPTGNKVNLKSVINNGK
jgi:mannose/fructose/N-acetylgalactosamine-specific phosphotransferase system component IIB